MNNILTDILKQRLNDKPGPLEGKAPSFAHAIVEALLIEAGKGNVNAIEWIWGCVYGPDDPGLATIAPEHSQDCGPPAPLHEDAS